MRTGVSSFTICRLRYADGVFARYGARPRFDSSRSGAGPAGFPVPSRHPGSAFGAGRSHRSGRARPPAQAVRAARPAVFGREPSGRLGGDRIRRRREGDARRPRAAPRSLRSFDQPDRAEGIALRHLPRLRAGDPAGALRAVHRGQPGNRGLQLERVRRRGASKAAAAQFRVAWPRDRQLPRRRRDQSPFGPHPRPPSLQGRGPAVQAMLADQAQYGALPLNLLGGHFASGKLKPLAVTSAARAPQLPQVPTVAESGFPGFEAYNWIGVFAPAAAPPSAIARLNGEFAAALREPEVRQKLGAVGFEIVGSSPQELDRFVRSEFEHWDRFVREFAIKFD